MKKILAATGLLCSLVSSLANAAECTNTVSGVEWGNGSFDSTVYSDCQLDLSPGVPAYAELQLYRDMGNGGPSTMRAGFFTNAVADAEPDAQTTGLINLGQRSQSCVAQAACGSTYPASNCSSAPAFAANTTFCAYFDNADGLITIEGTTGASDSDLFTSPSANYYLSATVPDAPVIGSASAGDGQASVAFTAPANDGGAAITGYTATSSPAGLSGNCASSPCTVSGLTNGTAYTFTVIATNSEGNSAPSSASNSVTPDSDTDGDGTPDGGDEFPSDPVEDADSDGDGIGDNGDAGGDGVGVRIVNAPLACTFGGPVVAEAVTANGAPGQAYDTQLGFVLNNCGSSVTIEAVFGEPLPSGAVAYKVSAGGEWIEIPGATISGDTVTYTVDDNGPLDDDTVLGQITDPVTVVSGPNSIPTLPWAILALLSGILALLAKRRLAGV